MVAVSYTDLLPSPPNRCLSIMQFSCAQTTTTTRKRIGAPYAMPSSAGRGVAWAPSSASVMTGLYCVTTRVTSHRDCLAGVLRRQSPLIANLALVPVIVSPALPACHPRLKSDAKPK